jgi:hypothetical protein
VFTASFATETIEPFLHSSYDEFAHTKPASSSSSLPSRSASLGSGFRTLVGSRAHTKTANNRPVRLHPQRGLLPDGVGFLQVLADSSLCNSLTAGTEPRGGLVLRGYA